MRIFILGYTTKAKELFTTQLSATLAVPVISRRNQIHEADSVLAKMAEGEDYQSYQNRITEWELSGLADDPQTGSYYLKRRLDLHRNAKNLIITGISNPYEFISAFNPQQDTVIWVTDTECSPHSAEVQGCKAIERYLDYIKLHHPLKEVWAVPSENLVVVESEIKLCLEAIGAKLVWQLP